MRVRLPLGRSLFFVSALLFALIALLPLRLALDWLGLDERGLAAREAEGSIWLGRLAEAQAGGAPLGDVATRLASLPLLLGRARLDVQREDEARPLALAITVSRHSLAVDDATGRLELGGTLASLDLADLTARFTDGRCVEAEGSVSALPAGDLAALAPGGFTGAVRCDRDALLLPLAGPGGATLNLRVTDEGSYTAELGVPVTDPAVRDRLAAAGFAPGGPGYVLVRSGSF